VIARPEGPLPRVYRIKRLWRYAALFVGSVWMLMHAVALCALWLCAGRASVQDHVVGTLICLLDAALGAYIFGTYLVSRIVLTEDGIEAVRLFHVTRIHYGNITEKAKQYGEGYRWLISHTGSWLDWIYIDKSYDFDNVFLQWFAMLPEQEGGVFTRLRR